MDFNPGSLVKVRSRDWVVMPSDNPQLVVLKPLGGSEEEMCGIFLPLRANDDRIEPALFPYPSIDDLGDLRTSQILYDTTRLSFRNGAGPFRSLAKLSFRPRAYQMVPLIMTLRQELIRLLIADDVGVGKTIEALLILREMLERRIIKRFAVVCLPHLCEQWQEEIKEKLELDAVIIRSNTQARLDREIQGDTSVYEYYPYQVISIDYIKSDVRNNVFVEQCPEMIIVDEAHTCSKPTGALPSQQQRYYLLSKLSQKPNQHLILLTATPHSGKPNEFQSLLGLLHKDFESIDLPSADQKTRRLVAECFIQRRRAHVEKWMGQDTPFPHRDAGEFDYTLSKKYSGIFDEVLDFARSLIEDSGRFRKKKIHYWSALALMRGVMSSPAAGIDMLNNRLTKMDSEDAAEPEENPILDHSGGYENDFSSGQIIETEDWSETQKRKIKQLTDQLEQVRNLTDDQKAAAAFVIIEDWLRQGFNPVIFCRYIATANYLGELLKGQLHNKFKDADIQVISSEDPDEVRKARIDGMKSSKKRVLVATDCLSEGINLQNLFTAVLHYDLPWNPNRLEQREGRIDRFGQTAPVVKTYMLYGKNNPIDGVVLDVILTKVREIRRSTGISVPFPEDSQTLLDTVLHSVLLNPDRAKKYLYQERTQNEFGFMVDTEFEEQKLGITKMIDEAANREEASRSIFAQFSIKAEEIETDLKEMDNAIGSPQDVENYVTVTLASILGTQISKDSKGYKLYTRNLPEVLKIALPDDEMVKVSFESPTPEGFLYLGRNHFFVEQLCQYIMSNTLNHGQYKAARASVVRCKEVDIKTTILLFRVRNVIEEAKKRNQLVAEEMLLWGYRGLPGQKNSLSSKDAQELLNTAKVSSSMTVQARQSFLNNELGNLKQLEDEFNNIAEQRCKHLVEAHQRFSQLIDKRQFQVVYPVLPMDVLGIYILLPEIKEGQE